MNPSDPGQGSAPAVPPPAATLPSQRGAVAGPPDRAAARDDEGNPGSRLVTGFGAIVLVGSALLLGFLLSRCGAPAEDDAAGDRASTTTTTATTAAADGDAEAPVGRSGEPVLRVQPQRALAPASSPLTLDVRGEGCAGGSGTLSIVEVGSAGRAADPDRLVLRRRIDIDGQGRWQASPLLVRQRPGTYAVSASCERRPRAEGSSNPDDRRDVFTNVELLELSGPFSGHDLTVTPSLLAQDQTASVVVTGESCPPSGSTPGVVSGSIFGNSDARNVDGTGHVATFSVAAAPDGRWKTTVGVPAGWARGSYGVQAACSTGSAYATAGVHFVAASQLAAPPARASEAAPGTAARSVRGIPKFTG